MVSLFKGCTALIGVILLSGSVFPVFAQRLDELGKGPFLKINGSVGINQIAYFASNAVSRRDPYNFFVNAGLNLDIHGWVIPFSFSYSNQSKGAFQQPFNQYSLNPSYKWLNAHLGYQSMSLSAYTLNGHTFSGVGLDLVPQGRWRLNMLAGRFQKATAPTEEIASLIEPAYERFGYGMKLSYTTKDQYDIIFFKAKDQVASFENGTVVPAVKPQDNLVMGFNFKKRVGKQLLFKGELGVSALTNDIRLSDSTGTSFRGLLGLFRSNSSTSLTKAFKSGLDYNAGPVIIGIGYERVDPEYRTLGSYYFNNDLQNITGNLNTQFLNQKVSLALNAGVQNNDLNKDKQSSMRRFVGALNLAVNPNSKVSLNASYSNFQAYINIRSTFLEVSRLTQYDNLDTLNYFQISNNATLGASYTLSKSKEKTSILSLSLSCFTTAEEQGGTKQPGGGSFYNFNSSYSFNLLPHQLSFVAGITANKNFSTAVETFTYGPTAGLSGSFFEKKLRNNLLLSWNQSRSGSLSAPSILNARLGSSFTYKKKHAMNLMLVFLDRGAGILGNAGNLRTNEFTATLGYQLSM